LVDFNNGFAGGNINIHESWNFLDVFVIIENAINYLLSNLLCYLFIVVPPLFLLSTHLFLYYIYYIWQVGVLNLYNRLARCEFDLKECIFQGTLLSKIGLLAIYLIIKEF
jgi:hypothetical protein